MKKTNRTRQFKWGVPRRSNHKGFSLVELIVVVAIMAVLVGVLAPQYLRYVEKARWQKDISALAEIVEAIKVAAYSDEAIYNEIAAGGDGSSASSFIVSEKDADGNQVLEMHSNYPLLSAEIGKVLGDPPYTTQSNTYRNLWEHCIIFTPSIIEGEVDINVYGWTDAPGDTSVYNRRYSRFGWGY